MFDLAVGAASDSMDMTWECHF